MAGCAARQVQKLAEGVKEEPYKKRHGVVGGSPYVPEARVAQNKL